MSPLLILTIATAAVLAGIGLACILAGHESTERRPGYITDDRRITRRRGYQGPSVPARARPPAPVVRRIDHERLASSEVVVFDDHVTHLAIASEQELARRVAQQQLSDPGDAA